MATFFLLLPFLTLQAQLYVTREAHVWFYSHAPLEDITAHSYQGTIVLKPKTQEVVAKVLIRSFQFKKALMQEHFNENYMESHKYPYATFKGKILQPIDWNQPATHEIEVQGTLTIHGVSREVKLPGKVTIDKNKNIKVYSRFYVLLKDYNIKRPKVVEQNIAEKIQVTVEGTLTPLTR